MSAWTSEELRELDRAGEVRVAGRRADGTSRTLVIVWHVVVDGNLYLRSVKGPEGHWYKCVARYFEGFLAWGGQTRPVTYTLDPTHDSAIDAAYTAKYGNGSATRAITNSLSKQTTLRVDPS
ncbi:hypothetical protein JOD63_002922 [Microbacterium terrae]|uniref:DUF2255 family protein n=1 Tax=Microbacterium terrae TaxID=69369 RepID=A0A0M2GXC7_9MICO|nr:DUF2255 family protein [Microbacterium terrae]KJL38404.1 hypothetical protein RS81_02675 [Microbacterium terrae]MBP1078954.1 hypothetical protein [Microbacterium terrae]GLJ98354.1 hypothetical protein GCM10017594_15510 [Microbacterium terrae]